MKKLLLTTLPLLMMFCALSQTTEDQTIRKLEDSLREAFLRKDTSVLVKLYAPEFVVNSPYNRVSTLKDILANINQGKDNRESFERTIEKITFVENIAIVMGQEKLVPVAPAANAGKTIKRRCTNIWMKNGTGWRLVARQSTVISVE